MGVLTIETIRELFRDSIPPCVSLYLPLHRAGPDSRQDPIRLKNGLSEAEERLLASGRRRPEVEAFLQPARLLMDRPELWRQGGGLALFLSAKAFKSLRLTLKFRDLVVVGERFHLKPLLPLLTGDGRFYILALSQNQVLLFEGSRDGIRELDAPEVPKSLEEGVNMDVKQHYFQQQLRNPSSTSERSAAIDAMLEPFLQRVDNAINRVLAEHLPLVLAGVQRICTAYRGLSKYPALVGPCVEGNFGDLAQEELHAQAWLAVKPHFEADRQQAAARYRDLGGSDRASHLLAPVLRAAQAGRVETLFVPLEENIWGRYDPERDPQPVLAERSDSEDLLDRAALEVLLRRGTVYAVPRAEMPGDGTVNAIFRY